MEEIILQKARQMVARVREKVLGEGFSVEKCIPELMKITNETALDVYKVLIEQADQAIREAKKERKEQGLIVERVGDTRKIVTSMGELTYNRSYFISSSTTLASRRKRILQKRRLHKQKLTESKN